LISLPQLRAAHLDINRSLLQLNRQTYCNQLVPTWFASGSKGEVFYIARLGDWQTVSARDLDGYIVRLVQEAEAAGSETERTAEYESEENNNSSSNNSSNNNNNTDNNRDFDRLLQELSQGRYTKQVGDTLFIYYNAMPVYFVRGEDCTQNDGEHIMSWCDIFMEFPNALASTLDATKMYLEANAQMCRATPIPTWVAAGAEDEPLFVNHLNWRHLTAEVLDDHIERCMDQMTESFRAEAARYASPTNHHSPTFKDRRT
jgi:hypothetical protein